MVAHIIVGGGSAGCVLANRLTADAESEVLLLEAGEPNLGLDRILDPDRLRELVGTDLDWKFETTPQPELEGRRIQQPRGKTLGGSSAINGMAWVRGHPYDYDNWAEAVGDVSWSFESILPLYKRMEQLNAAGDDAYHGTDGPLSVGRHTEPTAFSELLIEAGEAAGLERNPDFNGERQAGVGYYHYSVQEGTRHSAAEAYLKPVLDRDNLHVETGARATEVLLEGDRATGVAYVQDGTRRTATVEQGGEVLLAAGAIQSPQLLLLSGIGPAEHLREHDIDVAVDLPGVGRNLQDHLRVMVSYESPEPIDLIERRETPRSDSVLVGGFERSDPSLPAPDIQYGISAGIPPEHPPEDGFTATAIPVRPTSTGFVELASADPFDDPVIDPQYLTTERDREDIVTCIRRARELLQADVLAEYRGEEYRPGAEVQTDEEILAYAHGTVESGFHPTCTCKMGQDDMAVVDHALRVYGVEGLRVIDASAMPSVTGGNTNAPTMLIAEKGADLVRETPPIPVRAR